MSHRKIRTREEEEGIRETEKGKKRDWQKVKIFSYTQSHNSKDQYRKTSSLLWEPQISYSYTKGRLHCWTVHITYTDSGDTHEGGSNSPKIKMMMLVNREDLQHNEGSRLLICATLVPDSSKSITSGTDHRPLTTKSCLHFMYKASLRPSCKTGISTFSRPMDTPGRLGVVVVSVLATGPKGRGFKPGRGDGF
jgi:hypothetical protein